MRINFITNDEDHTLIHFVEDGSIVPRIGETVDLYSDEGYRGLWIVLAVHYFYFGDVAQVDVVADSV
jgi:hypothetical protein